MADHQLCMPIYHLNVFCFFLVCAVFDHSVAVEKFVVGILSNMILIRSLKLCILTSVQSLKML